jgi:hypothetical protein
MERAGERRNPNAEGNPKVKSRKMAGRVLSLSVLVFSFRHLSLVLPSFSKWTGHRLYTRAGPPKTSSFFDGKNAQRQTPNSQLTQ